MLRIQVQNVAAAARQYFVNGLSRDDYYQAATELPGQWLGHAAERLGLQGDVRQHDFADLTENIRPGTGGPLTPRKNDDRRIGYDISFHAPKSVSVAYFMTGDVAIRTAFVEAVRETMRDIEAQMQTRVRRGGASHDRNTGNMVWAEYIHFTSRPVEGVSDPHLHAHNFVFNCTFDHDEERWKAGQFGDIVRHAPFFQDVFHTNLSHKLGELGYPITPTEFAFELGPVPDGLIEHFSRRTQLIESIAEEMGIADATQKAGLGAKTRERKRDDITLAQLRSAWEERLRPEDRAWLDELRQARASGRPFRETPESPDPSKPRPDKPDASATHDASAEPGQGEHGHARPGGGEGVFTDTAGKRPDDKAQERSKEQEGSKQHERAQDKDHARGSDSKDGRETRMGASPGEEEADFVSPGSDRPKRPSYSPRRAIDIAIRHLMERESIVEEADIIRYAMRHSRGRATEEQLRSALDERTDIPRKTIKDKKYITTHEATREERRMIHFAVEGRGMHRKLGGMPASLSIFKLTGTDREVMKTLLDSTDRVTLLKMTGASYRPEVVKAAMEGIRQSRHPLIVVGANAAASRHAESMYGLKDVPTLGKFLSESNLGNTVRGRIVEHVIWVEQAGRVGTKDMHRLFELARKMKARVVLSGDKDGVRASQRGDAFEILGRHGRLRTVDWEVNRWMRSDFADAKRAIRERRDNLGKDFVENRIFRQTPEGGFVHDHAAKRYLQVWRKDHSAVLVGANQTMAKWLNRAVRSQLKEQGKLKGGDVPVLQLQPTGWSETEKKLPGSYRRGLVIEFHKATRGFKPGDRTKVVGFKLGSVLVRPRQGFGIPVELNLRHTDRFAVYEPGRASVSIGDRIELTRNVKPILGKPLRNRSQRTIKGIMPVTRELILDNGRILPRNFGHFRHAYATTADGIHGRSADSVIFAAEKDEWRQVNSHHLTSASEAAKLRFEVLTNAGPEAFDQAVRRTRQRLSASDFHFLAEDINEKHDQQKRARQARQEREDFHKEVKMKVAKEVQKATEMFERRDKDEKEDQKEAERLWQELQRLRRQEHQKRRPHAP